MTEFTSADLNRVLAEARETLAATRGDGGGPAEGIGRDEGGQVTVTAEYGRLTKVALAPEVLRLEPDELGERLVAAVNAALDDLRPRPAGDGRPEKPAADSKGSKSAKGSKATNGSKGAKAAKKPAGSPSGAAPAKAAEETADGGSPEQGLQQMEQITQAINEALAKIGGGR